MFVCVGVYRGIIKFITEIRATAPKQECEVCKVYREFLEIESQRARFYEKLLLGRAGLISEAVPDEQDVEDLPIVQRAVTLSMIRRQAEAKYKQRDPLKIDPNSAIAKGVELTEAEKLFQEKLANG